MSKKKAPRKKVPKTLAVINADNCTGCESCREVCPVDCIDLNQIGLGTKGCLLYTSPSPRDRG